MRSGDTSVPVGRLVVSFAQFVVLSGAYSASSEQTPPTYYCIIAIAHARCLKLDRACCVQPLSSTSYSYIAQVQCNNITAVLFYLFFGIQGYIQAWPHASSYEVVGVISESCRGYIRLVGVLSQIDPSC